MDEVRFTVNFDKEYFIEMVFRIVIVKVLHCQVDMIVLTVCIKESLGVLIGFGLFENTQQTLVFFVLVNSVV